MDSVSPADEYIALHSNEPLIRKLIASGSLSGVDVHMLCHRDRRQITRENDIIAEGECFNDILFLASGWAFRYRLLSDGRRQVLNFLVPGDLVGPYTSTAQHFVGALTDASICRLSRGDIGAARACSSLCALIESLMVAEFDMLAERMVSLGRRNAKERVAHLLLELCERLERVGLVSGNSFELPLTQEMIGDATGLSVVHVNRTLRALRESRLATVGYGRATIHDRDALGKVADAENGSLVRWEQPAGLSALHSPR